jgi:hypothetical protein
MDAPRAVCHTLKFKETAYVWHKRDVEYPKWLIDENFELMCDIFVHNQCKLAQSENYVSDICFDITLCALCPVVLFHGK